MVNGQSSADFDRPSDFLRSLLGKPLRILLTDDRTFVGTLLCVDRQKNITLQYAEEFLPDSRLGVDPNDKEAEYWGYGNRPVTRGYWGGREMGMVLIRGRDVVKIEVQFEEPRQRDGIA